MRTSPDLRPGMIPEDIMKFRWVDQVVTNWSGSRVAYTVTRADAETNGYRTDAIVRTTCGSTEVQITDGTGRGTSLAWDRPGERLAYSWQCGTETGVAVWDSRSGSTAFYPLEGSPMSGLSWSPDGQRLVGVRWTPKLYEDDPGPKQGIPSPTVKVIRRLRYKLEGVGFVHDRFCQMWMLDLGTGRYTQMTDLESDFSEPCWSSDGKRIALIGMAREQDIPEGMGQIYIYEYPSGDMWRLLPDWVGCCRSPVWSPDDRQIAFGGHNNPPPTNRRVFLQVCIADVESREGRLLAPEIDQEIGNYAVSDQRIGLSNVTVQWPANSKWIYFLLTDKGATHVYRIDAEGNYEAIVTGNCVCFQYSASSDGNTMAYGKADPSNAGDVYLWREGDGEATRLTALNPWLKELWLATPEEYWYDGLDGDKVHGWIMKPKSMQEGLKYPTVVYVHCSMFSWDFCLDFQCLASAGYVVSYFNQRGTTAGYGQKWTRASEGDQGGAEYREVMLGVEDLVRRPYVDSDRLGVTGGSCGGFLTNWIIGHTDRFKAAVTQRSISSWLSFGGTSDFGPENILGETGTDPWTDIQSVWNQSPLAHVPGATTPLLIIHSDEDHRCPIAEAEQLFAALRWRRHEVEFVWFEGENHSLSRAGRPGNRIERVRRIVGWFKKYMGTKPN